MMMPRHSANRGSVGCRLGGLLAAALMVAFLAAGAPASAKTITCGNSASPATQQKLKDAQAAQSYAAGDDLEVVGNCLVEGGLMGNASPDYRFGKVNIFSKTPANCPPVTSRSSPCGGTLDFSDQRIDFRASSIIIENGGSLIAGTRDAPIGTTGLGPDKTHSHVLTITLYGADPGKGGSGAPCKSTNCGVPAGAFGNVVALPGMAAGYTDLLIKYDPLFADDGDSNAYFGNKVLGVSYGGTLKLFGAKGAAKDPVVDTLPTNSFNSWRRLDKPLSANATLLSVDQAVLKTVVNGVTQTTVQAIDWEKGDDVVVTTTDYLPGHSEPLKIFEVQADKKSFKICNPSKDACDITKAFPAGDVGVNWPHNGVRFSLASRQPDPVPGTLGIDPDLLKNGAETRAAVALLSRSIVIRSGGDGPNDDFPTIAQCVPPPAPDPVTFKNKCYYGGHVVARQGFQAFQVQGVELAQLGQGGRMGHYPVHFHMARKTPDGTMVADSSINESMTRWIVLHGTHGVLMARNVGWKSIGHGFYLEDATEVNNKLYANLGIFARAAVVSHTDALLALDANPRKVPGILAQRLEIPPTFDPTIDANPSGEEAGRFPFHSDFNSPSVFWIMNGWNDFVGNMAAGAGMCGACYWLPPSLNSGMSRGSNMLWKGYASIQRLSEATAPLKSFYGNFCSSAEFAFMPLAETTPCKGFGSVASKRYSPVANPLAPDTCLVKGGEGYPTDPSNCVRIQPPPPPNPPIPPALVRVEDLSYYPTVRDGGRFPLVCDETKDCSGLGKCSAVDKTTAGGIVYPAADANPKCAVTVLDHFTSSFNWAPTNFAAILLRPQWYLATDSVVTDVQGGGLSFVTGGDYSHASALPGLWQLADHSVFIGNSQKDSPFAENDGPINPNSGLKCDAQTLEFCILGAQQWNITFENFAVGQKLFNIYDGPSNQADNAYLDIAARYLDKCGASKWDEPGFPTDRACWNQNYPIAFGPVQGIMRDPAHKEGNQTVARCFLPNAAIGWKQPNGFYYPPSFHSSNLFFNNVDIRHFVTEAQFSATGPAYKDDETKTKNLYCKGSDSGIFTGFSDVDRQTVLNDDDGSLTGLVNTLSVNKQSPFFGAPYETDECASQVGVTAVTPPEPAPQPTAKTSPYDYVTTVVLPGCTQDTPTVPGEKLSVCGCLPGGVQCKKWSSECTNNKCPGVRLYRQLLIKGETTAPFVRMGGQNTFQRSTLTANNGTYYVDTAYTAKDQKDDGFNVPDPNPTGETRINVFEGGKDAYVYFIFAKDKTKQDYQIFTGDSTVKPFAIRTDISAAPYKISKIDPATKATLPLLWTYDYNAGPGVLTVHVDMTPYALELATKPAVNNNSLCQPQTFCSPKSGATGGCGCSLKSDDPLVLAHILGRGPGFDPVTKKFNDQDVQKLKKEFIDECEHVCGNWAVKDLDCPVKGCIGFGVTLPANFDALVAAKHDTARPGAKCFPQTTVWTQPNPGIAGFELVKNPGVIIPGLQCKYTTGPAAKFCQ